MICWIEEGKNGDLFSVCSSLSFTDTRKKKFSTSQLFARSSTMEPLLSMTLRILALLEETNNVFICFMELTFQSMQETSCTLLPSITLWEVIGLPISKSSDLERYTQSKWQVCTLAKAGIFFGTISTSYKEIIQKRSTTSKWLLIKLECLQDCLPD